MWNSVLTPFTFFSTWPSNFTSIFVNNITRPNSIYYTTSYLTDQITHFYLLEYLLSLETTNTFILYDYGKQISPSYRASCREVFRDKFWSYGTIWITLLLQACTFGILEMCIYSFKKFVIPTSGSACICGKRVWGIIVALKKNVL